MKDPTETEKQQDTPTPPPSHHYYQYHYPLKKLQVLLNCVHKMPKKEKGKLTPVKATVERRQHANKIFRLIKHTNTIL